VNDRISKLEEGGRTFIKMDTGEKNSYCALPLIATYNITSHPTCYHYLVNSLERDVVNTFIMQLSEATTFNEDPNYTSLS